MLSQLRRVGKALKAAGAEDSKDEKDPDQQGMVGPASSRITYSHAFEIRKPVPGR